MTASSIRSIRGGSCRSGSRPRSMRRSRTRASASSGCNRAARPTVHRAIAASRTYPRQMTTPDPSPDEAFQRAAEELWMPVYRFALALTNDLADADDVAQEAFVRLWRSRASIDWSGPPIGWLLVTARRVAFDRFRRVAREFRLRPAPSLPPRLDTATIEA